jgi:hypothetical protein
MKGKLTQDLDKYKVLSGASAGAKWANDYLGKGYRAGDYFKTTLDSEGNYIAFDKASDLDGLNIEIGYEHIVQRFVIDKVKPLFEIAGWDIIPLENARDGKSKVEWL